MARLILASLQKHCEAILSSSNSTPKQKNDAKKLLNLIQNPPAAKGPDVMVTQHNLHDFFLKEWNLFKLPAASQDLYPHLARFVGLPFEFVLPRLRLARRVDWIIAKDDAMLLKPENDLSKYEDADILEAAEDRWFVPLLARFGAADKVPGKVREIESSQFRSSLLGSVQSHVKFVQGMLVKHGEMPMPPPEDMEVLPDSEKDRLKDLQRRNREEDKRFTTEGLGAVGGLVLVGRCLEIVEAAKRLNL